jgi:hypothetical protein
MTPDRIVTRIEFALLLRTGEIAPIETATAERYLAQGETRGAVGILVRREWAGGKPGEWLAADGGDLDTTVPQNAKPTK